MLNPLPAGNALMPRENPHPPPLRPHSHHPSPPPSSRAYCTLVKVASSSQFVAVKNELAKILHRDNYQELFNKMSHGRAELERGLVRPCWHFTNQQRYSNKLIDLRLGGSDQWPETWRWPVPANLGYLITMSSFLSRPLDIRCPHVLSAPWLARARRHSSETRQRHLKINFRIQVSNDSFWPKKYAKSQKMVHSLLILWYGSVSGMPVIIITIIVRIWCTCEKKT
jgi:hypothetical protein